jgi:hypothetical protein
MTDLPSSQEILVTQTQQILYLMQEMLKQHKPDDLKQDTLTVLIESSEHITNSLRMVRNINYNAKKGSE